MSCPELSVDVSFGRCFAALLDGRERVELPVFEPRPGDAPLPYVAFPPGPVLFSGARAGFFGALYAASAHTPEPVAAWVQVYQAIRNAQASVPVGAVEEHLVGGTASGQPLIWVPKAPYFAIVCEAAADGQAVRVTPGVPPRRGPSLIRCLFPE